MLKDFLSQPELQYLQTEKIERKLEKWRTQEPPVPIPETDEELLEAVRIYVGIEIPDEACCEEHVPPATAFCDAYFARDRVTVWKASRGFGGKSVLLAILTFMEAITLGASVNLMGGSGEQSERVHGYITGDDSNLPHTFWGCDAAPRWLLKSDPAKRRTRLSNGGRIDVLTASSKSVRGPHPQRLRGDEIDEMELSILDAAMGQAMSARGIGAQTVLSSTHHYPDGTMSEVMKRAKENGWPIYEWCYKESMTGWLTGDEVEAKRKEVTKHMWTAEYDLQEPNPEDRAIDPDAVAWMFSKVLGHFEGRAGEYCEVEPPDAEGEYSTGTDWAKKKDWTVIITIRTDVSPWRVVAFERHQRKPWPVMIGYLDGRIERYGGSSTYDQTGVGDVAGDYVEHDAEGFMFVGKQRTDLLSGYITKIENREVECAMIDWMYSEHLYASVDDVYSSTARTGHLPDSIAAGAVAVWGGDTGIVFG